MTNVKWFVGLIGLLSASGAWAVGLHGDVFLNITSDTADAAKNMAMVEARRQIVSDVLGQYSDKGQLADVLQQAPDDVLNSLVATTTIDDEQASTTTYSAKISMEIDADAARDWLVDNGVQNWLPDEKNLNRFVVLVQLSQPLANWVELNEIALREQFDINVRNVNSAQLTIDLPVSSRGAFTIAVREGGWRYANMDGALRIWK